MDRRTSFTLHRGISWARSASSYLCCVRTQATKYWILLIIANCHNNLVWVNLDALISFGMLLLIECGRPETRVQRQGAISIGLSFLGIGFLIVFAIFIGKI